MIKEEDMAKLGKGEEVFVPSDNHWNFKLGLYRERLTRDQLRYMLLNCPDPTYQGRLHTWKTKHIAAGIYEIWISEKPKEIRNEDAKIIMGTSS